MRVLLTGPVVVLLAASGCTSGHDGAPPRPDPLGPAAAASPAGTTRVVCDVDAAQGPVRLALDLPAGFAARRTEGVDCAWSMRVRVGDRGQRYDTDLVVTLAATGDADPLGQEYDEQKADSVADGAPDGDDAIYDLDLQHNVPVFGATRGERLSYLCFCDGQGNLQRTAQAGGVVLTWSSVSELTEQTDRELDQALAGAGTVSG